jgi:hypothetical protein
MAQPPPEPGQLAVMALDEWAAQLVQQAYDAGLRVPTPFLAWISTDATPMVETRARSCVPASAHLPRAGLATALRCAVRAWVAPAIAVRFPELRPLFPELRLRSESPLLSIVVRKGGWRCAGSPPCQWRLCEPAP